MSTKQVIVMRNDLGMRKGKMTVQACHASIGFLTKHIKDGQSTVQLTAAEQEWLHSSYVKVCVRVDSEEDLMKVYQQAKDAQLEVHLVTDNGTTEFHGVPTRTCVAIGPDYSEKIDMVTGGLKLL